MGRRSRIDPMGTRAWLKKQHAEGLREMEEAGTFEVFGEEKKTAHGH
jgi:hypothetical protein